MEVSIFNDQSDFPINDDSVKHVVQEIIAFEGFKTDEVTVNFVDRSTICSLHEKYFEDPSFTDCISFPMDGQEPSPPYHILGEIYVCPEAALVYAQDDPIDTKKEILLYIIHGLLHLMGYDDINEVDRNKMREREKNHLDHLSNLGLDL